MTLSLSEANRPALLASLILLVIAGAGGMNTITHVSAVVKRQQAVIEHLHKWRAVYNSLKPTEDDWRKALRSDKQVRDLLSVYRALRIEDSGLASSADNLLLEKIERVNHGGTDIGASAVTVTTLGKTGFEVTAATYDQLIHGLKQLAARRDLRLSSVVIGADGERRSPQATIMGFSVILRDGAGTEGEP